MKYTTKPIELPLSTEKEYVLVDVEGYKKTSANKRILEKLGLLSPFKLDKIDSDGWGVICDDFVIITKKAPIEAWVNEYQLFHEVIRQPESEVEWNGEGLPPVGVECEFKKKHQDEKHFSYCYIIGTKPAANYPDDLWLVFTDKYDNLHQHNIKNGAFEFRKPETPEQRKDRERLEAACELHDFANLSYYEGCLPFGCNWDDAGDRVKNMWLSIVDKTNYRK